MKIYTKAGDSGTTSLLGGNMVPKDHPRLEACGTMDELNAWIGLVRDQVSDPEIRETLMDIQGLIMVGSTLLANERKEDEPKIPEIKEADVAGLEKKIDEMDQILEPLKNFILPGGHTTLSFCHLARTTCRRAERLTIKFMEGSEKVAMLVKYLNRLSDFLFTLARKFAKDLNIQEFTWQQEK